MSTTIANEIDIDRSGDCYEHLLEGIVRSFNEEVKEGKEPLFTTDAKNLYDLFLSHLPAEARQHYNCNACRSFVDHYGGLVRIDGKGNLHPVMWKYAPVFFDAAVHAIQEKVTKADVTGMFVTEFKRLGIPKTGIWHHMAVDTPKSMILNSRLNTAGQVAAEKLEDHRLLLDAVNKYKIETVESAVNLLRNGSLARSEKFVGIAEWLLTVMQEAKGKRKIKKIIWPKVATAPAGFCHISSSMVGILLDEIEAGSDFDTIKMKFNSKVDPLKYQRPQAAPTAGNVAQAEKIVAKLGIENSLLRRFARLDELETLWKPRPHNPHDITTSGVFAGIKVKGQPERTPGGVTAPPTTMTWDKFQRTVLPRAKKIEYYAGHLAQNFSAIVTAVDPDAPPIINWDTEEHRNPFTWYVYADGSYPGGWGLIPGYVEVTGVVLQPNLWQPGYEHHGKSVFFILDGCKDQHNKASSLFPEHLKGELREVRSTIEAYSKSHPLAGFDEASACGIRLQGSIQSWNCTLRVTTDVGVSIYKLDRWD